MRVQVIQHASFEGPAAIGEWAAERGHDLEATLAFLEECPSPDEVGLLVIMGGPMAADDEATNPWLRAEKHFIAAVIAAGHPVLGICLGAQILAEVIGGKVRRNEHREIGWFPVERTTLGATSPLLSAWDEPVVVGQWHSDTFDLPLGIEPVLSSEACSNQAFVFDGRVVGVQFHLEWTEASLGELVAECSEELSVWDPMVMTEEQMLRGAHFHLPDCRARLFALLDGLEAIGDGEPGDGGCGTLPQCG